MNAPARTPTISASAIESFDPALGGCARKWAFSRLDGVPKPQSPGAALGSRCHELWESYLRDGKPFDLSTPEGRICDATRHQLPAPFPQTGAPGVVEKDFRFVWENVTWAGKKDLVFVDEYGTLVVLDHKTTSDFRYAKSERSALLGHPQAPVYAVDSCEHAGVDGVGLAWNYVKHNVTFDRDAPPNERGYTIKRAGRPVALEPPVRLIVGRAEAEDALGKHVPTAKRMLNIIAAPPAPVDGSIARALEPNPDACDAFGGCPYRAQCGLTAQEIAARITRSFATVEKEQAMGLRDRIAAIKAERGGSTQSSAIGVQQAIEAENAARAAQNAAAMQTPASVAAQSVFGPVNPPEGSHAVVGDVEPLAENFTASGQAQPLPPAENAARAATLRGSTNQVTYGPVNPPEGAFGPAVTLPKTLEQSNLLPPADAQPLPPAEAPTRPDAPQATRRRGRPPGSKNKVKGLNEPLPEGAVPAHEILTYVSAEECAAAEEARVSDTIPAPSQELLSDDAAPSQELLSDDVMAEIAKRVTSRIARALLATINENEEP